MTASWSTRYRKHETKEEDAGMLFVEYPKCTTCQKARKWLEGNEIAFQPRHIKEDAPTAREL